MPEPSALISLDDGITGLRQLVDIDLAPLGVRLTRNGIAPLVGIDADGETAFGGVAIPSRKMPPLDILVARHENCHATRAIRAHVMGGIIPDGAFWSLTPNIVVASPGLCLLQSCMPHKTLPNLELAMELCGTYSLAPASAGGIVTHAPITTTRDMIEQIGSMKGARNMRITLDILARATDGSRSPKETELYIMLTAPIADGGYGLPRPKINQRINVSGDASRFTDDPWYEADLLYSNEKVIVEYDGRDYHSSPQAIARDKNRRSVLTAMGYSVVVISKEDLLDVRTLGQKVAQISALCNFAPDAPNDVELVRRDMLHAWLFVGKHAHLPFGFGY